jgi:hypothetical protein
MTTVQVEHDDAPKVPTDACDHEWELAYRNVAESRLVHVCAECGTKKFSDRGQESVGLHAPWVPQQHRDSYEASLREPKTETPHEMHARLYREALTAGSRRRE